MKLLPFSDLHADAAAARQLVERARAADVLNAGLCGVAWELTQGA